MFSHLHMSWAGSYTDAGLLILRLSAGAIFIVHGWAKYTLGVAGVTGFLTSLGFPIPGIFAVILIATEIIGGVALITGTWTRLAALLTGFVALIATVTVHLANGFMVSGGGYEFALLLAAVCLTLLTTGAGKYAVDAQLGMK